jgi:hypothetical protein
MVFYLVHNLDIDGVRQLVAGVRRHARAKELLPPEDAGGAQSNWSKTAAEGPLGSMGGNELRCSWTSTGRGFGSEAKTPEDSDDDCP